MAHQTVKLSMNAAGAVKTDPNPVLVNPGDSLSWISDEGDVIVSFTDDPFDNGKQFIGKKGKETDKATIRSNAPRGKHFVCLATIGGRAGQAYGFDIRP
jgi:hypothetical protein